MTVIIPESVRKALCKLLKCCPTIVPPQPPVPVPQPPVVVAGGPMIAVFTQATNFSKAELSPLVTAMQKFVDLHFAPVWGTPAKLILTDGLLPGAWWMVFLDNADSPGALAYHDLTNDGMPLAKIFVETIRSNNSSISVAASHELAEMLVDPNINLSAEHVFVNDSTIYAYETADAVEADFNGFPIDGIQMTDFVYPSWFEDFTHPVGTKFSHMRHATKSFQITRGGYMPVFRNGQWTQIFAESDHAKMAKFIVEDRRGHRTESRGRKNPLVRSEV